MAPSPPSYRRSLMSITGGRPRHPPREEIKKGNVSFSMLAMMATGNPYVPKHTPWRTSSKNTSEETIEVPRGSTRDKREQSLAFDMAELREAWLEATGDPTLPRIVVERVNALKVGQEEEFIVKKHGKVSHSVKMRRSREGGTDVLKIELAFPHNNTAASGSSSSGEKKKEKKAPAITYLSEEEDEEDPTESSAEEEVLPKSKPKGKTDKGKGKGKEESKDKAKEETKAKEEGKSKDKGKGKSEVSASTAEAAPAPETATTPAPTSGEWTESEDTTIKSMKESNESWANIAKAVSRGKSEVQKRYKELMANNEEPPKDNKDEQSKDNKTEQSKGNKNDQFKGNKSEQSKGNGKEQTKDGNNKQAKNNDNGTKAAPIKSPKDNQTNTTQGLPTEPVTGFPPPVMPSYQQNGVPYPGGYGECPPPIANYHPAYGYLPPVNYGYLPPPVNYGYPPPYYGSPYPPHPPGFVNNYHNYVGYPGSGPYMDPRFGAQHASETHNSHSADDTYDWFYNGEPGVRYLTRDGKRVLWIRCNNGDAIKINDHILSEPPNGWRNDLSSKKKASRRESQSIHARINSDCIVRIMGAEVDEPDGGWGDHGEGSTIWTGSKGGSQPAGRSKKGKGPESASGWGGGSSNGGNQKDDSQDNNWGGSQKDNSQDNDNNWGSQKDNSQDNDNAWGGEQKNNSGDDNWGNDQKDDSKTNEEPTEWNAGNSGGSQKDDSKTKEWGNWSDFKTDDNNAATEPSKPYKGGMGFDWRDDNIVVADDKGGKGTLGIPQEKVPIPGCYPISPNDETGSNADNQAFTRLEDWTGTEEKKDDANNDTTAAGEWNAGGGDDKKDDDNNSSGDAGVSWNFDDNVEKKEDDNNNASGGDEWNAGRGGEWNGGGDGNKTNTEW